MFFHNSARKQSAARSHSAPAARAAIESLEGRRLLSSTISGMIYNDANADGLRQSTEKGLAGQTIYVDTNFDGKYEVNEPTIKTNSKGRYTFSNVQAGIYRLRLLSTPSGYRQTSPGGLFYDIAANGFDIHAANDFGLTRLAVVRGSVFNDTNHDGTRQVTESMIANAIVFLDKNNNGKLDKGEKSRKTTSTGAYRFNGLSAATYTIRVIVPSNFRMTTPSAGFYRVKLTSGRSVSNRNFGLA